MRENRIETNRTYFARPVPVSAGRGCLVYGVGVLPNHRKGCGLRKGEQVHETIPAGGGDAECHQLPCADAPVDGLHRHAKSVGGLVCRFYYLWVLHKGTLHVVRVRRQQTTNWCRRRSVNCRRFWGRVYDYVYDFAVLAGAQTVPIPIPRDFPRGRGSNIQFHAHLFDVSQPPGFDRKSAGDVTDASHPTLFSRSSEYILPGMENQTSAMWWFTFCVFMLVVLFPQWFRK